MITKKIIGQFSKELIKNFPQDVKNIYLFGSVAQGKAKSFSDVDILLVVRDKNKITNFVDDLVLKILLSGGPYFSVKIYDEKEYQHYISPPTFFMREILGKGVKL